jgi:hypothetical protein
MRASARSRGRDRTRRNDSASATHPQKTGSSTGGPGWFSHRGVRRDQATDHLLRKGRPNRRHNGRRLQGSWSCSKACNRPAPSRTARVQSAALLPSVERTGNSGCISHRRTGERRAERTYPGVSQFWVATGVTVREATEFERVIWQRLKYNFCGRIPPEQETDALVTVISSRTANICGKCISDFHEGLTTNDP